MSADDVADTRSSLWGSPAMRATIGITALGFAGYFLTLASLPSYAVRGGASATTAGLVTTVLVVVTMTCQLLVPKAIAAFGSVPVLAVGLVALGLPAPLYALGNGMVQLCAVSAVRGAGFATLTVLSALLTVQVAPAERTGEAVGLYGLAIAIPNLAAVPAGVTLVQHDQIELLAWLAACPLLALPLLPAVAGRVRGPDRRLGRARVTRQAVLAAAIPSAVLLGGTLAIGGVVTVLRCDRPDGTVAAAALLLAGSTGAATRWGAGRVVDRIGPRVFLPAALACTATGLATMAAGLRSADAVLLIGAALFGAGFGVVQNLTLVLAFARAGSAGASTASTVWNTSFDLGTAAAALTLGPAAAVIGLPWAYVAVAVLLTGLLPLAHRATRTLPATT